jgi:hypothetical protein
MDENLVGYALKALEPDEQAAVEAYLDANPDARVKLESLERILTPLAADADEIEPVPGLAVDTLARIAEHKCRPLPTAPRAPRGQFAPSGWPRVRRADVLAAAVLLIVVGGLALPAVLFARQQVERVSCQNNMRAIWASLQEYADKSPDGAFPKVEATGPHSVAGAFLPMLRDAGVLANPVSVSCPARPGQEVAAATSLSDLDAAYTTDGDEFGQVARNMAGGYAYTLGYRNGPALVGLYTSDPQTLPILADQTAGNGNSLNHGGFGQNVLYIGGNVRFCAQRTVGEAGDDIYVNRSNFLRAGEGRSDTVLGPGDARPLGE